MKSYPTKKTTPQRMTRKRMRRDVFMSNKQFKKLQRKARREARTEQAEN